MDINITELANRVAKQLNDSFAFKKPSSTPIPDTNVPLDGSQASFTESAGCSSTTTVNQTNVPDLDDDSKMLMYIKKFHVMDIEASILNGVSEKNQRGGSIAHFRVRIPLDTPQLLDLLDLEMIETASGPLYESAFKACFSIIKDSIGENIHPEFVELIIFPKTLPFSEFHGYHDVTIKLLMERNWSSELFSLCGILTTLSLPLYYTHSQYYKCINSGCRAPNTLHIKVLEHNYKITKRAFSGKQLEVSTDYELHPVDLVCSHCGELLCESISDRVSYLRQSGTLTLVDQIGCCLNTVQFIYDGVLSSDIDVGDFVQVIASRVDLNKQLPTGFHVQLHNIRKENWMSQKSAKILNDSKPLLHTSNLQPFQFSQYLVDKIGSNILPDEMWRKLRLCLLMSLSSISEDSVMNSNPVNIMIVTNSYTPSLYRFLKYVYSMNFPYFAPKNGIVLTKWNGLSAKQRKELMAIVKLPKRELREGESAISFEMNCALWTIVELTNSQKPMLQDFAEFDVILNLMTSDDDIHDINHLNCVFLNEMDHIDTSNNRAELIDHIQGISNMKSNLLDDTQEFISRYVAIMRQHVGEKIPKSISDITMSLITMATAHSKLCSRATVTMEDAVIAMILHEETIKFAYGFSLLDMRSRPEDQECVYDTEQVFDQREHYFQELGNQLYDKLRVNTSE
ncbi:hypothetical protein BC833DRAFT_654349 [Globomyces pollinis-pini]|nr:hypothetical protein BC833DRAFT_654349 [Globomyces pollinis-pini]